ncbi:MAG: glycosyltransferase [Gammaproteobacteria bacterium]|nr:glycosyltransferase [Gammaproteobacteria bacterium]
MKISIITAVRNAEHTIGSALESVQRQTYPDIAHIVVDGLSTDGTMGVVRRHSARLAKVVSEHDSGIYDAFNKGLRLATGEVVAFLNADDVYTAPDVVAAVQQTFERTQTSAVFGDVEFVRPDAPGTVVRRYSSQRFSAKRLRFGWMPAHPSLFLKRRLFEQFGGFDASYRIAGDFELVARLFGRERIGFEYLPRVFVRMHTGGASTRGIRSTLTINREILRACRQNGIPTNMALLWTRFPAKLMEYL